MYLNSNPASEAAGLKQTETFSLSEPPVQTSLLQHVDSSLSDLSSASGAPSAASEGFYKNNGRVHSTQAGETWKHFPFDPQTELNQSLFGEKIHHLCLQVDLKSQIKKESYECIETGHVKANMTHMLTT